MEKRNGEGGLRDHPGCEERGRGEVQEWRKSCGSTVPRDLEQEEAIISPHARMKTLKIRPRDGEVKSYIQRINCNLIYVKSKDPSSEESFRASQPYILSYESHDQPSEWLTSFVMLVLMLVLAKLDQVSGANKRLRPPT